MNSPENPSQPPPLPRKSYFQFEPMPSSYGRFQVLESLLKHPGRIIYELYGTRRKRLGLWLLVFALGEMAIYGLVVGSVAGGSQLWIAPAKLALGTLLSMVICLPSLYIFSALGGGEARPGSIAGALAAAVCLTALLLLGFAPVAWIFSQSTDSIAFMGALHLLFWLIGSFFGLRLVGAMGRFHGETGHAHLGTWYLIFILVCLQMTTTLRPIIGRADHFLPAEKKFFLTHWVESLGGKG